MAILIEASDAATGHAAIGHTARNRVAESLLHLVVLLAEWYALVHHLADWAYRRVVLVREVLAGESARVPVVCGVWRLHGLVELLPQRRARGLAVKSTGAVRTEGMLDGVLSAIQQLVGREESVVSLPCGSSLAQAPRVVGVFAEALGLRAEESIPALIAVLQLGGRARPPRSRALRAPARVMGIHWVFCGTPRPTHPVYGLSLAYWVATPVILKRLLCRATSRLV